MYTEVGTHLNFMVPIITLSQNAAEVLKEMDIGASSADHGEFVVVRNCKVTRLMFTLTSEVAGGTSVAPTVIFKKRPTPLSATNEATIGTVTVPDATAVGKCVYLDVEPVELAVGDSVEISHVIGTGTPTGIGVPAMICVECSEEAANNSDMIASA